MIPKIIHYCWLSGDTIPEDLQNCMKSWKDKLPDYKFILWDLNRFDLNSSRWVKEAFSAKKYAFAADYIRLYALYNYGGIYMDMDVEVLKSFDDILDRKYLLAYEDKNRIEAGIMGSEPHSEWTQKSLEYYKNRSFYKKNGTIDNRPLPMILNEIISNNFPDMKIMGTDVFTTKSLETGIINVTENSYTIHHFAGSWTNWSMKLKRFIFLQILKSKCIYTIYKIVYRKYIKKEK